MEHKGRSLISASAVFLGMLFPLQFPNYFWYIAFGVSAIAALLVFWVFGEHVNLKRFKEDWFTIVFVFLFTLTAGLFAYTVPHPIVQALLLGSVAFFVYYIYQVASRLKRGYIPSLFLRNLISFASIFGIFFSISNILKWSTVSSSPWTTAIAIILSALSVFVISEFLFESQGFEKSLLYSLAIAFSISEIVWISSFWIVSYPESQRIVNIGVPLPAILATVFFYLSWGLSHHRLEGNMTKKVLWEYVFISVIFVLILLSTARWLI